MEPSHNIYLIEQDKRSGAVAAADRASSPADGFELDLSLPCGSYYVEHIDWVVVSILQYFLKK